MMIELKHIFKSYDGRPVLSDINLSFASGRRYCIMSPSGSGKTTLLRILMGLEQPDSGTVAVTGGRQENGALTTADGHGGNSALATADRHGNAGILTVSAVFQEDRLCESFSPLENVLMCTGHSIKPSRVRWEMSRLLPEECLTRPVSTLSGGMKRRVAVIRAVLTPSDILLMDEPFTGMDEELKRSVISFIRDKQDGRLLILSTHHEEDVAWMEGELVRLEPADAGHTD